MSFEPHSPYAGIDALNALTSGGHDVSYGLAAVWAGNFCIVGFIMTLYLSRRATLLQSPMLTLDARSWMVSAFLSLALLLGFGMTSQRDSTRHFRISG